MTKPVDIEAELAICDAATPGPWEASVDLVDMEDEIQAVVDAPHSSVMWTAGTGVEPYRGASPGTWTSDDAAKRDAKWRESRRSKAFVDAAFIAAARTGYPAALRELEQCRRELAGIREVSDPDGELPNETMRDQVMSLGKQAGMLKSVLRVAQEARNERDALRVRQQELLETIRKLSSEVLYPEESRNVSILIAEVGTLRSTLNEYEAEIAAPKEQLGRERQDWVDDVGPIIRKATWLLYVGRVQPRELLWGASNGVRLDEGFHSKAERDAARLAGKKPVKRLSTTQNLVTPPAFAQLLIDLALGL